jgi:hypothetical protein
MPGDTVKTGRLLTLHRADGRVYLDRWGISTRLFGVYLHRMAAPDPGRDLHDHPWPFWSLILRGGYVEERARVTEAAVFAALADRWPTGCTRGVVERRKAFTVRGLRLGECHRIVELLAPKVWTLVVRGATRADRAGERRLWGFYLPSGWVDEATYDETVRADRRDLWSDQNIARRPWERTGMTETASNRPHNQAYRENADTPISTAFVLDLAGNPHPVMLEQALIARQNADQGRPADKCYWYGFLDAMCAATGETPDAVRAWMDRQEGA